ncbi:hypothetical protein DFS34DRAFT_603089 [Phlyctochytrium arcticum]|nr:hypothetical protein DFS34DRAFT_603089 [Phlyctochytrium arcticum]
MTQVAPISSTSISNIPGTSISNIPGTEVLSLYERLQEKHVMPEDIKKEFGPYLWIERRFCGFVTSNLTMMGIYIPTYTGFHLLIGPFFGVPVIDQGKAPISPDLRRKVLTVASMVAQCAYCSAHYCGIGDAFKGSVMSRKKQVPLTVLPKDVTENERICLRAVVSAVKIPARVTPEMRKAIIGAVGTSGLELIAGHLGFTGFSNTNADTTGTELTPEAQAVAEKTISAFGWKINVHKTLKNSKWANNAEKFKDDLMKKKVKPQFKTGGLLTLILTVGKAGKIAGNLMANTPSKPQALDEFVVKRFGFKPRYYISMSQFPFKRILIYNMWQFILGQTPNPCPVKLGDIFPNGPTVPSLPADHFYDERFNPHLTADIKIALGYVYFVSCDNMYLAAHFAKIAQHVGIPVEVLKRAIDIGASQGTISRPRPAGVNFMAYMCVYTFLVARRQRFDFFPMSEKLVDLAGGDEILVMDLVSALCMFAFCQRYTAVWNDDELPLEAEVQAMVDSSYGEALGLKGKYLGANSKDFFNNTITKFTSSVGTGAAMADNGQQSTSTAEQSPADIWGGKIKY